MDTPILFLIYNRAEYTRPVFEAIRAARPRQLFIAGDGPRPDQPDDADQCATARAIVSGVDWPCEVRTLYQSVNLGCKMGMSTGISWFFDQVEEGIILEDDCLPDPSFFPFCTIMLERYRDDEQIMMIGGANPATVIDSPYDYFFSRFYNIWGWACWRRAWKKFDIRISSWQAVKATSLLADFFPEERNRAFLIRMFDDAYGNPLCSVWSLQWTYACLVNGGLAILPTHNLISNIGVVGTHEMNMAQLFLQTRPLVTEALKHPETIDVDQRVERLLFDATGLS